MNSWQRFKAGYKSPKAATKKNTDDGGKQFSKIVIPMESGLAKRLGQIVSNKGKHNGSRSR